MKTASTLGALVFGVVALLHLARLVLGVEILIAGAVVPMWVSVFGGIVTAGLAVALFREASGSPGAPEI